MRLRDLIRGARLAMDLYEFSVGDLDAGEPEPPLDPATDPSMLYVVERVVRQVLREQRSATAAVSPATVRAATRARCGRQLELVVAALGDSLPATLSPAAMDALKSLCVQWQGGAPARGPDAAGFEREKDD